jgi:hypothetical protein
MGEKLGVFLGHPALQGLPAALEVPGKDNHGPDADEVRKAKALRDRFAEKAARPRSRRKPGTSARRPAARRTRG